MSVIFGAVSLISCCLVALTCYFAIRRGIRGHDTQILQEQNHGRTAISSNFDLPHYRKTLRNMMWISQWTSHCLLHTVLIGTVCKVNPWANALYALFSSGVR